MGAADRQHAKQEFITRGNGAVRPLYTTAQSVQQQGYYPLTWHARTHWGQQERHKAALHEKGAYTVWFACSRHAVPGHCRTHRAG